jgi:hypothetical protein
MPEDVSGFDGGEATPPRTYLLAGRLCAGGLSGSALILLAISSFAVGIGAVALLPRGAAPAQRVHVQVAPPKRASAESRAVARAIPKLTAKRPSLGARARGHQTPPRQVAQDGTGPRPAAPADKAPSTPTGLAAPGNVTSPVESPVTASTQGPATDPVAIELPISNVVDTLVSTAPALPAVQGSPAIPASPQPVSSVVTTATTLVGTP